MRRRAVLLLLSLSAVPAAAQRPLDTVQIPGSGTHLLTPTEAWQTVTVAPAGAQPTVDENYYVTVKGQ